MNKVAAGLLGSLGMALLVSITIWVVNPSPFTRYVLMFPDTAGGDQHHEIRNLPHQADRRDAIHVFLSEIILGPADVGAVPFLPKETRILGVFLDEKKRLFVNFSGDVLFTGQSETVVEDVIQILKQNILFNFRFVDSVTVTIDGQVPGFPPIIEH